MVVVFFLSPDVRAEDLGQIEQKIKSSPSVVKVVYVNRQQAWEGSKRIFPSFRKSSRTWARIPSPLL
jgi:cell division protein FtsX